MSIKYFIYNKRKTFFPIFILTLLLCFSISNVSQAKKVESDLSTTTIITRGNSSDENIEIAENHKNTEVKVPGSAIIRYDSNSKANGLETILIVGFWSILMLLFIVYILKQIIDRVRK